MLHLRSDFSWAGVLLSFAHMHETISNPLEKRVSSDYVLYRRVVTASVLVSLIDKKLSHYPNKGRHSLEYYLLIGATSGFRLKY